MISSNLLIGAVADFGEARLETEIYFERTEPSKKIINLREIL